MLMASIMLITICAIGLAAMATKYFFGPAPADYHLRIMRMSRDDLTPQQSTVFSAIYRVMGASFFGLSIALISLSWFAISEGLLWAKLTVIIVGLSVGLPVFWITYSVYKMTGVDTPWKPAAVIVVMLFLAFILSII